MNSKFKPIFPEMPETPTAIDSGTADSATLLLALHRESEALESKYREMVARKAMARETAIKTIKSLIKAYDVKLLEIKPPPFQYRDPVTGATWSGRGKPPAWIRDKDHSVFRVATTP